ncbi:MAG: hypothetical protein LBH16_08950 [Treponema sp.]|nr:hypothetical protein [Treponema sp.]
MKNLHGLLINDTSQELFQEGDASAKERVWQNLSSMRNFRPRTSFWRHRLSVPLPAAAAAVIILALIAALWFRGTPVNQLNEPSVKANIILAAEEEIPGIIPAADMSGVLQYLGADGADILILRLPESRNFFRTGDPAIIRAADYSMNQTAPQPGSRRHQ